jgi:hypothetical protein
VGGEVREEAERILAQRRDLVGEFDLDLVEFYAKDGVVAVFHPVTSPSAWMIHIAAALGNPAHRTFAALRCAERWFMEKHPSVAKLFGFIREDNLPALRAASFMGYVVEGHIKDYVFQNETLYGIIVMGRRL